MTNVVKWSASSDPTNFEPVKWPRYYVCRTLLGGEPDVNRRTIYDGRTQNPVCVFNQDMSPWTSEDDRRLKVVLEALLNDAADERPTSIPRRP